MALVRLDGGQVLMIIPQKYESNCPHLLPILLDIFQIFSEYLQHEIGLKLDQLAGNFNFEKLPNSTCSELLFYHFFPAYEWGSHMGGHSWNPVTQSVIGSRPYFNVSKRTCSLS